MKIVLILTSLTLLAFGQYETAKIDMHGGKESNAYDKKKSFRSSGMGLSLFLDKNASKKKAKEDKK